MDIQKYQSLKQSFLYVECASFHFVNVRLYALGDGRFDVITVDGYGKFIEIKYGRT